MTDDTGDTVEHEFAMAALAGTRVCPDYGKAPWPAAYEDRMWVLREQLDALKAVLRPLYDAHHDAHRAFEQLGGGPDQSDGDDATRSWRLPAGALLMIRAGFALKIDIGEIGRGVIPPPDPLVCLASALCDAETWASAMTVLTEAAVWAIEQAREWHVNVPGFD